MPRSEICKNCCPNGGALFDLKYGEFEDFDTGEVMVEPGYRKICRNCGYAKKVRERKPRPTMDQICQMQSPEGLRNCKDLGRFHYFADAGVWKKLQVVCNRYAELARERGITKYPLFLHWRYNRHDAEALYKEISKSRANARRVRICINQLQDLLDRASAALENDFQTTDAALFDQST